MYDIVIIGAGIVGTAVARELSKYQLRIAVLERNNEIAGGATKANSGIIYNGHTARAEKLKGRLTLRGRQMFEELCRELDVAFKPVDMLIAGFDEEDDAAIEELRRRAETNGIAGIRVLSREEALRREPFLNDGVRSALLNPGCGIVDPWEVCFALAENAAANGVEFRLNTGVTGLAPLQGGIEVETAGGTLQARAVINCAGINTDLINRMAGSESFSILPKRGQYAVLDRSARFQISHIVAHCKSEKEKSVFLIPTLHGNVMIGPSMEGTEDRTSKKTTAGQMQKLMKSAHKISSRIPEHQVIRSFAGLKAKCSAGDFLIRESEVMSGLIHAAGINNPGLTCSPAIAAHIADMVASMFSRMGLALERNPVFNPQRERLVSFKDIPDGERNEWIRRHPGYGRIVCRCEQVTEGEIRESISREPGACSVNGVKHRTRAGMGRCQGGFCGPKVTSLLSEELDRRMEQVLFENNGSELLSDSMP
ncbi:glycerol-3-phosphate dehydrogenase [Paenibacillus forsythiae]|uniref:Glycerol-3-phosphate dehydrogenase n=1 Tax=Paenibacillus forsythiae TaxID=365616 RepID=A0ABU3HCS2_9BACL|nr:NAD(P)/FAD-dependent oxidoreductase [Paenibacillus forsythiae]MDT3427832.1 glycerol-3-phosphate dehydrogenase [Paenibacillus forsythiae]